MAPTPIQTTHVLSFGYTIQGLTHHQHCYVDAQASGDPTGFELLGRGSSPEPMTDAIDEWEDIVGPMLGTGTAAAGVTLYHIVSGALIPIYSGAIPTITPGGGLQITGQQTMFFRDGLNLPFKFTIFETNYLAPFHNTSPLSGDIGAVAAAFIADMLNGANGHLGAWMHSRSDSTDLRYIAMTVSLNRRLRRDRGLA